MTAVPSHAVSDGPRCAEWARAVGVDPVGTAGTATSWLLVEWPLPWPRDASEVVALAPVVDALVGTGTRLQLVVPTSASSARAVVLHRRPAADDGWFGGFERVARAVAPADVVDAAVALVTTGEGATTPGRDVLVCGHGARDRCCGRLGTALALGAVAVGLGVHRTSHTGGHRFAPTAVLLPEGTCWAFLDDDALRRIVDREGPLDDLLPRYRGCSAIGGRAVQAAERLAFAEVGWSWLDHRRRGTDLGEGRVRIDAISPAGAARSWEVDVEPGRLLPVPECGRSPADAPKSEAEVVVVRARRADGGPTPTAGDRSATATAPRRP